MKRVIEDNNQKEMTQDYIFLSLIFIFFFFFTPQTVIVKKVVNLRINKLKKLGFTSTCDRSL